jgi:hypothetical protein
MGRVPERLSEKIRIVDSSEDKPKFCACLYSMGKGGVKSLDCGPKFGQTRKETLVNYWLTWRRILGG